ncbi:MAG: MATE family efflux transporter [Muribaculaceae bacterium]|nr:MATE family efflux transporter [Muribaculaceae bacterium]
MNSNQSQKLRDLATLPVGRLLWRYSLPAVTGMLVMSLYNVVDRIFIGQGVGPDAIAGLAVTFPVLNITTALGVLVGAGASSRVSIHLGEGRHDLAEHTLGNSLTLLVIFATCYMALFYAFLDPVLRLFGASDATLPYARDLVATLLPGLFMTNLAFSLNNIMRASGYPTRAMMTMVIGAVVNIVLDPIFIFTLDMGIRGAAIATDIAMGVCAVFVFAHFFRRDVTVRFRRGTFGLQWRVVWSIVAIGAAPSLVNFAASFINIIINRTLHSHGGDMAIGAAGIFTTYATLLTSFVLGICLGMQPIIGYNYGARQLHRLRRTYMLAVAASTAVTALGCAGAQLVPQWIARAFTVDASLIAATDTALRTAMAAFVVVGFQIVSTTLFQSIGAAAKSVFLSLTRQVLILIPLLLVLPDALGLRGVWLSFPLSDLVATLITAAMVAWQLRRFSAAVAGREIRGGAGEIH